MSAKVSKWVWYARVMNQTWTFRILFICAQIRKNIEKNIDECGLLYSVRFQTYMSFSLSGYRSHFNSLKVKNCGNEAITSVANMADL